MRKLQFLFIGFLGLFCLQNSSSAPIEALSMEQMKQIMVTVPEKERNHFIKTNIILGYEIEQLHQQESSEDGELAVKIFDYFVDNQEAIRLRKERLNSIKIKDSMCFPEPIGCIDPNDPGIRP